MSQIHGVGLMLGWHEEKQASVNELHPPEGVDPHEHQDPVQDWHRDEFEDGGELDREPSEEEHTDASDPLLSDPLEHGGLPRGAALAVHLEAVHMTKAEDSGGHTPGQSQ